MAAIGHTKSIAQAQERLGEPIEAVCGVGQWGSITRRFLGAMISGQPTRLSVMVLTDSKLYLFEPRLRGLGAELLCVPYRDIVHMERHFRILGTAFRLTLADGSRLGLKALRGRAHGRDSVDRLAQLTQIGPRRMAKVAAVLPLSDDG